MDIWFKTLLLFVVFNKVHLYRQLMNTTCLELAKPSNKHLRLSCNDTSIYHCLLNGNSTNEFEICKKWKWIPDGNCAYLNEYNRNIDARRCLSSAELACPKTVYRSEETIKYAACYVKKNTNTRARQVRNTTCLELAKPSNQQFRLSCNNIGTYHCLLDQNYTKEFEICKMWKWISKEKCAYYSMYSGDNIDERNCTSSSHFVCPEQRYRSENTTNYSACYIRNNPTTVQPLTSSPPDVSIWTSLDGNGGNATSSRISETAEKHIEMKSHVLPIILGIIAPLVSLAVIYFIFVLLKYEPLYRKAYPVASQESSNREGNRDSEEQQRFLRNKEGDTSESPPIMRHDDEIMTEAGGNDEEREEEKDGKSTNSISSTCGVSKNLCNKQEDDEGSTDVCDDTIEG